MECEINNLIRITSLRDVMQLNNENILIYFPHGLYFIWGYYSIKLRLFQTHM
jgi:hypothetical protein